MIADAVVLDTDAASVLQRDDLPDELGGRLRDAQPVLTFVTVGELCQGAVHAQWGARRVAALERFVAELPVLPYSAHVARSWGQICGTALRRGRRIPPNDGWVAASCLTHRLPLLTFNERHFAEIPGLQLMTGGNPRSWSS